MPGSSPAPPEQGVVDGNVMCQVTRLAEANLLASLEKGEWSMLEKMLVSVTLRARCGAASRPSTATPRARPSRGRRPPPRRFGRGLSAARAIAEHALADAEAKGDIRAAVDVNLVLAFLAARDGHFDDEALRRYEAVVREDPQHDSRPYELADMLCSVCGFAKGREAWWRSKEKLRRATRGHAALPVIRDQLMVAAALGHGNLMSPSPRG
uniref:Uncharacterized protein n=1 Tax=Oryza punctata TaxID=4537 RepID=A0A0E0JJR4_ORYPU